MVLCAYPQNHTKTNIKFWRYFFIFRRLRLKIKNIRTIGECKNVCFSIGYQPNFEINVKFERLHLLDQE